MQLPQTGENIYGVVITAYEVITTLLIVMPDFNLTIVRFTSKLNPDVTSFSQFK
jgi:hypothetical protein